MRALSLAAIAIILAIVGVIFNGIALSYLWVWFIVPPFGLPMLGIAQSIGLAGIVGYLTYQEVDVKKPERTTQEAFWRLVSLSIGRPLVTLAFGYIVTLFL